MFTLRAGAFFWLCILSAHAQPERGPLQPVTATLTLSAADMPLSQVLAKVAEQTGVAIKSELGEADPKLSLKLEREPFWKALDLIAEKAGARVSILRNNGGIVLDKRGPDERQPIVSYSGPFRFCVKRISSSLDLDTGGRTYTAAVEVAWEPGLQPLFLESMPQAVAAVDDKGHRLPVPDGGKSQAPVDGRTAVMIDVPLPTLPRRTTNLALLEGHLEVVTPSKMLRFAFPTLDRIRPAPEGAKLIQDGVTCKITKVIGSDRWTLRMVIDNPSGGTILESYQPWDSNNVMTLESKDGKTRLAANSYVRESESARHAVLSYHFSDRAKLARLKPEEWTPVYGTPALVVTMPLSFSFKNVPLP